MKMDVLAVCTLLVLCSAWDAGLECSDDLNRRKITAILKLLRCPNKAQIATEHGFDHKRYWKVMLIVLPKEYKFR